MSKYRVSGTIMREGEFEADSDEEAVKMFKEANTYQHDSGMKVSPVVEEISKEEKEEEEVLGSIHLSVNCETVLSFDMDDCVLVLRALGMEVVIPDHRLEAFGEWIETCKRWSNGFANDKEMRDLEI